MALKRLDLGDIGSIAEAVAAVGVLVSLIYLSVQIDQNTNAIRASSYQSVADHVTTFQMGLAQDGELAQIFLTGLENQQDLTPSELLRFDYYLGVMFARFDTAVELYHRGMIDDKVMTPYSRYIIYQFQFPGVEEYWQRAQVFFSDEMRAYVEDLRDSTAE